MVMWNPRECVRRHLLPFVGHAGIRLLARTMKISIMGQEKVNALWKEGKNVIIAFWHERQLMMPLVYGGRSVHILISLHRDGELISRTVQYFGMHSVRGSTTRGGMTALRKMVKLAREGADLAVTPDGPRGPRWSVQPGVIHLAKMSGLPIFPLTFSASRRHHLQSWDRFLIPLPFSRGVFLWGDPIIVPHTSDRNVLEEKRQELEKTLIMLTERTDRFWNN